MPSSRQHTNPAPAPRVHRDAPHESGLRIERSFEPRRAEPGLPRQVIAFGAGTIDQARAGNILMVCVRDTEVDSNNWEPFAQWLIEEVRCVRGDGALVLDLRHVRRLSSRGLRALGLAWQQLTQGGVIAVCGLSPLLQEIFEIAHYQTLFEIHPDSTTAYRALSAKAART